MSFCLVYNKETSAIKIQEISAWSGIWCQSRVAFGTIHLIMACSSLELENCVEAMYNLCVSVRVVRSQSFLNVISFVINEEENLCILYWKKKTPKLKRKESCPNKSKWSEEKITIEEKQIVLGKRKEKKEKKKDSSNNHGQRRQKLHFLQPLGWEKGKVKKEKGVVVNC